MTTHELKCWPEMFDAVADGRKTFDVRKNDRGYQTGDRLVLRKYRPDGPNGPCYLSPVDYAVAPDRAAMVEVEVTYMLSGFGIEPGHVVMSIRLVSA
jgi:hypothetical protein